MVNLGEKEVTMKEKIVVRNFSVIDNIEIDVKKINILIGPQAAGKSVLAKLVYFFKTISSEMSVSIILAEGKRKLDHRLKQSFALMFPEYIIRRKDFEVTYYYGHNFITITNEKAKSYKSFKISYSNDILKKFKSLKADYKRQTQTEKLPKPDFIKSFNQSISRDLEQFFHGMDRYYPIFILAVRSFFANIERNIFSFLTESIPIEYMLKIFGSFFQDIRERYYLISLQKAFNKDIYRMCNEILGGEYYYDRIKEGLITEQNEFIYLRDSSSAQQEVAPLLVSLIVLSNFAEEHFQMFIEEPEAHLFPEAQRKVVEVIAAIYNLFKRESGFFITTHSPYILTSFNNLIQAENTRSEVMERFEKGEIDARTKDERLKALNKVVNPNRWVSFDDVAAYLVKDGKCKNLKDNENKFIRDYAIDEVSDITASIFDKLLDISLGDR